MSPKIQIYVRCAKTGREAWDCIAKLFEEKILTQIIKYRSELYSMMMKDETLMVDQINYLKTIAEQLESLDRKGPCNDSTQKFSQKLPHLDYGTGITQT